MYNLRGHQCNGASRRFNGHYQGRGKGVRLVNGWIYQIYNSPRRGTWGLLGEVGQPLKLRYRNPDGSNNQFRQDIWADNEYIPLMIIPHATFKFTNYFSVDIADLVNHTFTCSYNVIIENTTFTATMTGNGTFTFDAFVVKIAKADMLTRTSGRYTYYYLPQFDIAFDGITCAIQIGNDVNYEVVTDVIVGDLAQDVQTGLYNFATRYRENFVGITHNNITDYNCAYTAGSVAMSEFGDKMSGFIPLSPFQYESDKTSNGTILGNYMLFNSTFNALGVSGYSNWNIEAHVTSIGSVFSYLSKFENSEFELTAQNTRYDYFYCAVIKSDSSAIASPNIWSWTI